MDRHYARLKASASLLLADLTSAQTRRLTSGSDSSPVWNEDDSRIAFITPMLITHGELDYRVRSRFWPRRVAAKAAHCFVAKLAKAIRIRIVSRLALRGFDSQRSDHVIDDML